MLDAFYRAVLPGAGHYALFLGKTKQHVWADSIEALVKATQDRIDVPDLYFAPAAFQQPGFRTQDNVSVLRAFRLDIDAGEEKYAKYGDKVYRTQYDALVAVKSFIEKTKVKPSYIISSGWGLHVYFCLTEDLSPSTWRPVAKQLQALAQRTELRVDPTVTCDEARVLRPLGALHSKSDHRVRVLYDTGVKYDAATFAALIGFVQPKRTFDTSINEAIVEEIQGPPKSITKILRKCAAIRFAGQHQDQISEPIWRAMLGVVKHTKEGLAAAHRMSQDHPEYDAEKTEEKFNNWNVGPATCDTFAAEFPGCAQCQYRGKIKSPITLGELNVEEVEALPPEEKPVVEVPATEPDKPWHGFIPEPFYVGPNNCLMVKTSVTKKNDEGEDISVILPMVISHSLFWFSSWSEATSSADTAMAVMHTMINGRMRTFELDQVKVGASLDFKKFLASKAIFHANDKKAEGLLMDYTRAALERLKSGNQRPKVTDRVGMRLDGETLLCAHGKYMIYPDGHIVEAMMGEDLREFAAQFAINALPTSDWGRWESSVWDDHIRPAAQEHVQFLRRFYGDEGWQPYQLAIMMCLASPLMAFVTGEFLGSSSLPPNGMSVSLTSRETARGKTTAVRSAMLAFGRPMDLVKDSDKMSSTDIARISKLAMSGTMPVSMDEMGRTEEGMVAAIVSMVANSSPRTRSKQYGGVSSGARWALINLLTANRSIRDMIATAQPESAAIQMRLMEIDTSMVPHLTPQLLTDFNTEFARVQLKSTGALGALLHLELCKMGPVKLNSLAQQAVTKAAALVGSAQEARFLWRSFGAVLVLHAVLRSMDMELFPLTQLVAAFKEAYASALAYVESNSLPATGAALLEKMLNDLRPQILVTQTMSHGGHERGKLDVVISASGRTPDAPVGRFVRGEGRLYIDGKAITEWAHKNKISPNDVLADCKRRAIFVPHPGYGLNGKWTTVDLCRRIDLYRGLGADGYARAYCYCIDTRKLEDCEIVAEGGAQVIQFPGKTNEPPSLDAEVKK